MARWGEFKWGQAKWGAVPVERRLTWYFAVDWYGNLFIDGRNEAFSGQAFYLETSNGRQYFLDTAGEGFEPVESGKLTIKLRDPDRTYDPYNTESPLYGLLVPGKRFRLHVRRESDGVREQVMTGTVTDIRPSDSGAPTVTITGENDVRLLKKKRIYSPVMETYRFNEAIEDILLRAEWPNAIDVDSTVSDAMPYWWAGGNQAFGEIKSLTDAVIGRFFVAEDGTARYLSRLSDDESVATIQADDINLAYGIRKPQPWDSVRNVVRVYARARRKETNTVLWELTEPVRMLPGETKRIGANFAVNNAPASASQVYDLTPTSDYLGNTASDGGGTDKTASLEIVRMSPFATAAIVEFRNNDAGIVFLTWARVRGDAIVADLFTFAEDRDEASLALFDEQELEVKSDWLQSMNDAIEASRSLLSVLSTPRIFPRVKFRGEPDLQFGVKLFNRVTFDMPEKLLSGDMRAGFIRHRSIGESLEVFDTEMYFEPTLTGNISGTWVFPATFGVTTVFG